MSPGRRTNPIGGLPPELPTLLWISESNTLLFGTFNDGGSSMAKVMRCNDVVGNCDFVARGESEQDVLQQAADHARTAHQVNEVTPELAEKVRSAIRDEAA
jgi:predicted small metal-binding protein